MINPGDSVKYIGTAQPKHTGKILKVRQCLVNNNFMLWLPKGVRHATVQKMTIEKRTN